MFTIGIYTAVYPEVMRYASDRSWFDIRWVNIAFNLCGWLLQTHAQYPAVAEDLWFGWHWGKGEGKKSEGQKARIQSGR